MGQPEIKVSFKKLAETANVRSARGIACVILKDATVTGKYVYTRKKQIKESYASDNLALINDGFDKYGVNTIVVYSILNDGSGVSADTLENALNTLKKVEINYLACNFALEKEDIELLKKFKAEREALNMDLQIVATTEANDKTFINFVSTGIKLNGVAIETHTFNCKLAFILASLPMTQSATFYVLDDVTAVDDIADEDAAVDAGKMFITFDGEKYKLSRAVNSMTTLGTEDKDCMKKIKVVEGSLLVKGDIYKVFRDNYVGKNNNDYNHRLQFVSEINRYLINLAGEGILNEDANNYVELDAEAMRDYMEEELNIDTSKMTDVDVLKDVKGYCGSKIFLTGNINFVDAMEDMELVINY